MQWIVGASIVCCVSSPEVSAANQMVHQAVAPMHAVRPWRRRTEAGVSDSN
jgi:hypothetical protein